MANSITFEIQGLRELTDLTRGVAEMLQRQLDLECKAAVVEMRSLAIKNIQAIQPYAPEDQGHLRASMQYVKVSTGNYEVVNTAFYSPYIEFGTKGLANPPAEWAEYAAQFKAEGQFAGTWAKFEQNIFEWAKRKGIVSAEDLTEFVYFVTLKIYVRGLAPRPFLYPAYVEVRKKLLDRVRVIVRKALKQ